MSLTAKDFQIPLLQVLGDLTGCKAGVAVAADSTYAPIMALMGIQAISDHGTEAASGQPMVQRWIQWACKNLRKTGQMDLSGRGQWILTDKGAQEAATLQQGPAAAVQGSPAPVAAPVALPSPPVVPAHLRDPYILELLLAKTPCLGYYSAHGSAECATCPVTEACRNKQYSNFAAEALRLCQEDAKAAKAAAAPPSPAQGLWVPVAQTASAANVAAPQPAGKANRRPKLKLDMAHAEKIVAFEESLCADCNKPIPKSQPCLWVENSDTKESLMLHLECGQGAS